MRLLILSDSGCARGIAPHLEYEGHSVTLTSTSPVNSTYTFAICDTPNHTTAVDKMQKAGVRILGSSNWANLIENNASYKANLIKAIGYTPATADVKGEKVVIATWFNGNIFVSKFLVFNYTKMLTGDLGVEIPSAGYVGYFNTANAEIVNTVTAPLEKFLRKTGHKGAFCVECICNSDSVYVSDISAGLHTPYPHLIFENTPQSKTATLSAIMDDLSKPLKAQSPWAAGVMVSVYPYPYAPPSTPVVVRGLSQASIKHSWPIDLSKVNGEWVCGSSNGCLGYMVARGDSCVEAVRRIYRTLTKYVSADGMQYRTDIGKDISYRYRKLREMKLVKEDLDG